MIWTGLTSSKGDPSKDTSNKSSESFLSLSLLISLSLLLSLSLSLLLSLSKPPPSSSSRWRVRRTGLEIPLCFNDSSPSRDGGGDEVCSPIGEEENVGEGMDSGIVVTGGQFL